MGYFYVYAKFKTVINIKEANITTTSLDTFLDLRRLFYSLKFSDL